MSIGQESAIMTISMCPWYLVSSSRVNFTSKSKTPRKVTHFDAHIESRISERSQNIVDTFCVVPCLFIAMKILYDQNKNNLLLPLYTAFTSFQTLISDESVYLRASKMPVFSIFLWSILEKWTQVKLPPFLFRALNKNGRVFCFCSLKNYLLMIRALQGTNSYLNKTVLRVMLNGVPTIPHSHKESNSDSCPN